MDHLEALYQIRYSNFIGLTAGDFKAIMDRRALQKRLYTTKLRVNKISVFIIAVQMHLSASESVNSQRCSINCFGYKQLLNGYSLINSYQNIISVSKIPGGGGGYGGYGG